MALTLDDILAKSGGDPVMKSTLESILGRPLQPTQAQAQQEKSPEGIPYFLQTDPDKVQQQDQNPVPQDLRGSPTPPPPVPSDKVATADDENDSDDDDDDDSKASIKVTPPKSEADDHKEKAPITEAPTLDFGSATQNASGLADAQEAQRQALNDARIQRGVEQLGAGILRTNPNTTGSDEMTRLAGMPVEQYKELQANEANDPNSGISKGLREYMKKFGLNVADGATASQISQVAPYAFKNYEAQQAQTAKSQDLAEKLKEQDAVAKYRNQLLMLRKQQLDQNKEQARQDRLDKQDYSESKDVLNQINALKASSRSPLGQASLIDQKANRLLEIVNNPGATVQDMSSAAADLNSMVSQTTTMNGTQHQMYNNLASDWINGINYLTSSADPVQVPKVKAHLADVATKMQNLSQQILANNTEGVKQMHKGFESRHPGQIDQAAKYFTGNVENSSGMSNPKDKAALDTIKKNNPGISDQDAQSALQRYKVTKGMP